MKLIGVFAALLTVAVSYPVVKPWTLSELEKAVMSKEGDPAMRKYIEDAFNEIMYALYTQTTEYSVVFASFLSPSGKRKWTEDDIKAEAEHSNMKYIIPYYKRSNDSNEMPKEVEFIVPALDISTWSVNDVSDAIEDPDTKPALLPYLEKAKEEIKTALEAEVPKENVTMVTPVGLIPVKDGTKYRIVAFRKLE